MLIATALETVLPMADLSDFETGNLFGASLVIGGLLIGAYGNAGGWRWVSAVGIACVIGGAGLQFAQAGGEEEQVIRNGAAVLAFIVAVIVGIGLIGSGQNSRNPGVRGVSVFVGLLALIAAGTPVVAVILSADWSGVTLLFIVLIYAIAVLTALSMIIGPEELPGRASEGSLRLLGFALLVVLVLGLVLMVADIEGPLGIPT